MRKEEFLRQLGYLLQDIPDQEQEEAVNYYRDYLEEAGPDNEEAVLREFGSPERIAAIVRSDHNGDLEAGGSFTERGYEDERFREPNYQVAKRMDLPEEYTGAEARNEAKAGTTKEAENVYPDEKTRPRTSGCLKVILVLILIVVAGPALLGAGGATVGIATAVLGIVVSLFFVVAIMTLAFLFSGVVLIGAGIAAVGSSPLEALMSLGIGLLILGIGLLALVLSVWFYGKLIPRMFKGIGNLIDTVSDRMRGRR